MCLGRAERASDTLKIVVVLADSRSVELGVLVRSTASELGWLLLQAIDGSGKNEWGVPNLAAYATSSIHHSTRETDRRNADFRGLIGELFADAFSWLISNGLVGPASENSGSGSEWVITTAGRIALLRGSAEHVHATRRLHVDLHPDLERTARVNFERGDYEIAVFAAMKAVEVALRSATGASASTYGVDLAKGLRPGGGFEIGADGTPAEVEAYPMLYRGALGAFKNPTSHRIVEFDDPVEAADIVHLADLLLRILDRERRRRGHVVEE